jgi:hypothetical protein
LCLRTLSIVAAVLSPDVWARLFGSSDLFKGEPRVVRQKKAQRLFDAYLAASRQLDDEV